MAARRQRVRERALLAGLSGEECREVLRAVVRRVPGAGEVLELEAMRLLDAVEREEVALAVRDRLRSMPHTDLAARSGRQARGGYVDPGDAAWQLLDEAVEPWIGNVERRVRLGLVLAASELAVGIVAGLVGCEPAPESTVLSWVPEAPRELADEVVRRAAQVGIEVDRRELVGVAPDWFDFVG